MVKFLERIAHGEKERRSFRERRASSRLSIALPLEITVGETSLRLVTNDVSLFGLSLLSGTSPRKGTVLVLKLYLPDDHQVPVRLRAQVLGPLGSAGGVRLKFLEPAVDAVRRIHHLLK